MSINNDVDAEMVAGLNRMLEEDEREALEGERLRAAAVPPNADNAFANPLRGRDVRSADDNFANPFQGRDVRFDLPPELRRAGGAAQAGRVPSNASAVSQGTVAVFGRINPRTLEEIQGNMVLVRKEERGPPGSKIFIVHRAAATRGLSPPFLGSQHLQSKNEHGENVQKASKIQDQFVSNLEVMAAALVRMVEYDLRIPLQIPKEYYDVVNVEERWDMNNPRREIVDLSAHWGSLSVEHVGRWQQDYNGYALQEDHVSQVWLKELMSNSLDPELKKQVEEKYKVIDDYRKGGIMYWKIAVDMIFKMSSMSEDTLKSFIKDFGKGGLAKIPKENVRLISSQIDGVAERLADSNVLRSEVITQYVTGYTRCSVPTFADVFKSRLTALTYLDATGDTTMSSMTCPEVLKEVKQISTAAKAMYDHLHAGNQWNLPGKHGLHATTFVAKCDNCGSPDHLSNKCKKPRDEERCKKARDEREARGRGGGGRGGAGRGGKAGRGGDRAPWGDDDKKKGANGGVMMIDGKWMMHCSRCDKWNDTHTTKFHGEQSRNAASFQLPETHPWYLLSGNTFRRAVALGAAAALPSAGASTATGSSGSVLGSLTRVVENAMTSTDNSEFSSFLSDVLGALGN